MNDIALFSSSRLLLTIGQGFNFPFFGFPSQILIEKIFSKRSQLKTFVNYYIIESNFSEYIKNIIQYIIIEGHFEFDMFDVLVNEMLTEVSVQ
jgi:hypothetical protein